MAKEIRNFNRRFAKEYHWFRTLFYMSFLYLIVYPIYNIYYDYKVIGRENLPPKMAKRGKYIYAANHVSQLDPPMVVMGAHCPIAFMAKKELFEPKFIENAYKYHKIEPKGYIEWDDNFNITDVVI